MTAKEKLQESRIYERRLNMVFTSYQIEFIEKEMEEYANYKMQEFKTLLENEISRKDV